MMQLRETELQYKFTTVANQSYIQNEIRDLIQDMLVTFQLQIFHCSLDFNGSSQMFSNYFNAILYYTRCP
jgi:hypothetical protein